MLARYWAMSNTDRYAFLPGAAAVPHHRRRRRRVPHRRRRSPHPRRRRRRHRRQHRLGPHRSGRGRRRRDAHGLRRAAVAHAAVGWRCATSWSQHWLPEGFNHVFFTSGGSESTDSAIRLARAYQVAKGRTDRWKVIGRHPSYHGMTTGTMAVASHSARQKGYEPLLLPFPKVPWDDPEQVLKVIEQEDPATIAGFIAEPITGAAGACLTASDEYWQVVTDACREHDILLIADEVMTGYGRTGTQLGSPALPVRSPTSSSAARDWAAGTCRSARWPPPTRWSRRCAAAGSCTSRSPATTRACAAGGQGAARSCAASSWSQRAADHGRRARRAAARRVRRAPGRGRHSRPRHVLRASSCAAAATPWCRRRWSATCGCTRPARARWPTP